MHGPTRSSSFSLVKKVYLECIWALFSNLHLLLMDGMSLENTSSLLLPIIVKWNYFARLSLLLYYLSGECLWDRDTHLLASSYTLVCHRKTLRRIILFWHFSLIYKKLYIFIKSWCFSMNLFVHHSLIKVLCLH